MASSTLKKPYTVLNTGAQIAVNTSLNDCKTPGVYRLWGAYTDMPSTITAIFGYLVVFGNAENTASYSQILVSATSAYVYYRGYANSKWYSWVEMYFHTAITDISNKFTYQFSSGICTVNAIYDQSRKIVSGTFSINNAPAFSTNTAMIQIESGYRPKSGMTIGMLVKNASGWGAYKGTIDTNGYIKQALTATATDVYCSFEYQV